MARMLSRKSIDCVVFGQLRALPTSSLPSYEDVMRACQSERFTLLQISSKEPAFFSICKLVADSIVKVWNSASVPNVSLKCVNDVINNIYHHKFKKLLYGARTDTLVYQAKLCDFQNQCKLLFDIAACKCSVFSAFSCVAAKKSSSQRTRVFN